MTEPEDTKHVSEPDGTRAGFTVLAALGIAGLLIIAAGVVGVTIGMRNGGHTMMWGGTATRLAQTAPVTEPAMSVGFQLDGLSSAIVQHYDFARANPGIYEQIPCFCGCRDMLAHRNLADCFVTHDGAWESHAAGCDVCIQESQMVMRMMDRGMGPQMMNDRIVGEFGGPMMAG
jgi:hypothetical protein